MSSNKNNDSKEINLQKSASLNKIITIISYGNEKDKNKYLENWTCH